MENKQCLVSLHRKDIDMGISDRKEREKQEMRKRIIDAAMQVFMDEGYEKTSIRNIADKIEYSPATIYLYYKDKDELFYEVQSQAFEQLNQVFAEKINAKDPMERLEQLIWCYLDFGMSHPDLYDLMFIIRSPMNVIEDKKDSHWEKGDDAFRVLCDILQGCMDHLRFDDVKTAALTMWSMAHGLISLDIRCRIKVMHLLSEDIEQVKKDAIKGFIKLIKK